MSAKKDESYETIVANVKETITGGNSIKRENIPKESTIGELIVRADDVPMIKEKVAEAKREAVIDDEERQDSVGDEEKKNRKRLGRDTNIDIFVDYNYDAKDLESAISHIRSLWREDGVSMTPDEKSEELIKLGIDPSSEKAEIFVDNWEELEAYETLFARKEKKVMETYDEITKDPLALGIEDRDALIDHVVGRVELHNGRGFATDLQKKPFNIVKHYISKLVEKAKDNAKAAAKDDGDEGKPAKINGITLDKCKQFEAEYEKVINSESKKNRVDNKIRTEFKNAIRDLVAEDFEKYENGYRKEMVGKLVCELLIDMDTGKVKNGISDADILEHLKNHGYEIDANKEDSKIFDEKLAFYKKLAMDISDNMIDEGRNAIVYAIVKNVGNASELAHKKRTTRNKMILDTLNKVAPAYAMDANDAKTLEKIGKMYEENLKKVDYSAEIKDVYDAIQRDVALSAMTGDKQYWEVTKSAKTAELIYGSLKRSNVDMGDETKTIQYISQMVDILKNMKKEEGGYKSWDTLQADERARVSAAIVDMSEMPYGIAY